MQDESVPLRGAAPSRDIMMALLNRAAETHGHIMDILNGNPTTLAVHYAAFQAVNETLGALIAFHFAEAHLSAPPKGGGSTPSPEYRKAS